MNMTLKNEINPVEIFSGTQGEVDVVITLLGNAEIQAFLKDEYIGTIAPYFSPGGTAPITMVVASDDYKKAKQVVDDYLKSRGWNK